MGKLISVVMLILGVWLIFSSFSAARKADKLFMQAREDLDRAQALIEKEF